MALASVDANVVVSIFAIVVDDEFAVESVVHVLGYRREIRRCRQSVAPSRGLWEWTEPSIRQRMSRGVSTDCQCRYNPHSILIVY